MLMVLPACERSVYPFAPTRQCLRPDLVVVDTVRIVLPADSLERMQTIDALCAKLSYDHLAFIMCRGRLRSGALSSDTVYMTQRLVDDNCWISYFPEGWDRNASYPFIPGGLSLSSEVRRIAK